MAVSLYDVMRPTALFAGVGAASVQGSSVFQRVVIIIVALAAGVLAFGLSQIAVRHVAVWVTARSASRKVDVVLMAFYVAVFIGIALAAAGAGLFAFSLTNKT